MKVIALDPGIVDPKSPANRIARDWYVAAKDESPQIFPTIPLGQLVLTTRDPRLLGDR